MHILIVGSGYIGGYLARRWRERGDNVVATSRGGAGDTIPFDMMRDDLSALEGLLPEGPSWAVVCAAESRVDRCRTHREEAREIDVIATERLLERLEAQGYRSIFLSSDAVFDGTRGDLTEDDAPSPINEYGRMKAEVEHWIQERHPRCCIARLPKVIGRPEHERDMLAGWKRDALAGREIHCIRDNFFSPVDVDDVADCLRLIMERRSSGTWHVCGERRWARAELCRSFLRFLGLDAHVTEKSLDAFAFADARPLDTSMRCDKARAALGWGPKDMEETFARYL